MGIYSESFVSNEVELSPLASPDNYEYNEEKIQQQTVSEFLIKNSKLAVIFF